MKSSSWSQDIQDIGALAMVAVAMMVIGYLAARGNETATGALISVISAGTGYYLRGRIVSTDTGSAPSGPITATANRDTASVSVGPTDTVAPVVTPQVVVAPVTPAKVVVVAPAIGDQ